MAYERKTYDLLISEELKEILISIESESLFAQLLLKKRHDKESLVDSPVNFISVSSNDRTKLAYLSADRIEAIDPSLYWSSSRRFAVKPGSFVTKLFKDIPSKEVEKFSNLYRSQANKPSFSFNVVKGEAIREYYHFESYAFERGSLGASCMKHENCQDYMNIYVDNREQVKMLVMLNQDNRLIGRALLWDFDSYKIMDRIYTTCDEDLQFFFKKWATDNGYLYKSEQNWFNTLFFEQIGQKRQELKLSIKLTHNGYRRYPYMDTFKFINYETGELYNYMPEGVSFRTLCSSDGSRYDSDYLRFDSIDKVLRYRGDAVWIEYLGIYTSQNNTHYSETNDQYILNKDCFYDETIQDYIFSVEFEEMNNKEKISERKAYFEKRALELAERNSKVRRKSSANWLESVISNSSSYGDLSSSEALSDIYRRITEQTGIPQGYFSSGYNEYIADSENNSDPMPEPTPEPEF